MIVSGGANVYPAEVEGALLAHPGVEAAVVVGLPDDDMGSVPNAIVRRDLMWPGGVSEDSLKKFLATRLAQYKWPRSFEFTEEMLRDDAGKIRRSQLRQERIDRRRSL